MIPICVACGTSFPPTGEPPVACPICDDERQFVPPGGQRWTTPRALAEGHRNAWRLHEPGLFSLHTVPAFAIDQRAFLVRTGIGNVLFDCLALIDDATAAIVAGLGGIAAIAVSHPHYYTRVQDWSRAFGDAPIHLHAADRDWVMRPCQAIHFWEGDRLALAPDATLLRLGGHFSGGTVLHWGGATDGAGVVLSGDVVQVAADRARVSFLWSYPNMLPLPAAAVEGIAALLAPWRFARLYGAFAGKDVLGDAEGVVARSAARYGALLRGA